ncbi:hypothetical protein L596_015753 [Steinernema carpocapsae]|uniref:Carboxylic ester hydrolase n=1 Tax=Steinernema carpocapsae TaxID=34508 RepID=A0A4U5NGK3_STECR|nr:hypothetical protein L596_015753 [Steinernema carpocapsae]
MRLLTVLLLAALASFGTAKVVETLYGPVEGFEYNLSNGKSADIFLGIPFAKAPVGELRFEKPKKLDKWTEVKQAQAFGPSCQPHHRSLMMGPKEAYAEDCLTTNIMAPSKKSSDPKGYPVFVFIYGGAFELGGSAFYPYQNISENFVSQDLIFVTFNYRLSAFGFFSTGDHHMPGNLGLWDQAAALHFIQETITAFGGDPERVTISGESAGAASVSALTFSPHSNQFFQQAIAMSGSINCPWAKSERVVDVSHELAQSLGCKEPSDEILLCMKAKSVDEILDGIDRIGPTHDHLFPYKFHPRFDNEFFPFSFDKLLKDIPKMPFMTGVTAMEGGLMATMTDMPALVTFGIKPENWKSYSAKQLKQFILNKTLKEEDPESLKEELVKFYVNKEGKKDLDWKEALERFILVSH